MLVDLAKYREDARQLVKSLYKDEKGEPFILTDGQCDIFNLIFKKLYHRVHIETFTRYGKSETISMALLTRICNFPEQWAIAAGNEDQAHIITSHLIKHIFDNDFTRRRFVVGPGESEESIRRYRNKSRLNFKLEKGLFGEVFVTNAKGALGFGAPNVIEDESALIPDDEEALVFRMLGDLPDNYLFKVGNTWDSSHFRNSSVDPNFFKVHVDYYQGIKEGRIMPEMVEEARKKPYFGVLYECKFPPKGQTDEGWFQLISREEVDRALVDQWFGFGVNKLGGDVAGEGKNFSVAAQRRTNMARILHKSQNPDTMSFAEFILGVLPKEGIAKDDMGIDKVGLGKGVCDIISRNFADGYQGVNVGDKFEEGSDDAQTYYNLRARNFWRLYLWLMAGGKLLRDGDPQDNWYQLTTIYYTKKLEGMKGKMQIVPKERTIAKGIPSPDVADALALTFVKDDVVESERPMTPQKEIVLDPYARS